MSRARSDRILVAIVGSTSWPAEQMALAFEVGRSLALQGAAVLTGGAGQVEEAATNGAKAEGGLTLGLIDGVGDQRDQSAKEMAFQEIPLFVGRRLSRLHREQHGGRGLLWENTDKCSDSW